ncbi:MAG: hypothetical protein QXN52_09665, partial [Nitrososphaerota archaeon]
KYCIFGIDSIIIYKTEIFKDPQNIIGVDVEQEISNRNDFEQNYKDRANRPLLLSPIEADSIFNCAVIEIPEGQQSNYYEWDFGGDVELRKVRPRPKQAQFGDSCHLEVWTKPGVLGPNPVKVREFGHTYLEGGDGWFGMWYEGVGTGKIPSFCTLRCVYEKGQDLSYRRFYIDIEVIK